MNCCHFIVRENFQVFNLKMDYDEDYKKAAIKVYIII